MGARKTFRLVDTGRGALPWRLAARFSTPAKRDQFAHDMIAMCRWRDEGFDVDAALEHYLRGFGADEAEARAWWDNLPDDARQQEEARWSDLHNTVADDAVVFAEWHIQEGVPFSALGLRALACALELAIWRPDRPIPAVGIRGVLGLPSAYHYPDVFFHVVRVLAEARAQGVKISDNEVARRVGSVSRPTVTEWRRRYDLDRFTEADMDVFFPSDLAGVPDDPTITHEAAAERCMQLAEGFRAYWRDDPKWRKPDTHLRVGLFAVAVILSQRGVPCPPEFIEALAAALRRQSPATGVPVPSAMTLEAVGLAGDIENPLGFSRAANADAAAILEALDAADQRGAALHLYLQRNAARLADDHLATEALNRNDLVKGLKRAGVLPKRSKLVRVDRDVLTRWWPISAGLLAAYTGIPDETIQDYRKRPEYRRLVMDRAMFAAMDTQAIHGRRTASGSARS